VQDAEANHQPRALRVPSCRGFPVLLLCSAFLSTSALVKAELIRPPVPSTALRFPVSMQSRFVLLVRACPVCVVIFGFFVRWHNAIRSGGKWLLHLRKKILFMVSAFQVSRRLWPAGFDANTGQIICFSSSAHYL